MSRTSMFHRACVLGTLFGLATASRSLPCQAAQANKSPPTPATLSHEDSVFVVREEAMWTALQQHDTAGFARAAGIGGIDVDVSGARRVSSASTTQYVEHCQVASSALRDFRVVRDAVAVVVTYTVTVDETCWGQKTPSPLYVLSVYERDHSGWRLLAHSETPAAHW